jgi:hypothetical protein
MSRVILIPIDMATAVIYFSTDSCWIIKSACIHLFLLSTISPLRCRRVCVCVCVYRNGGLTYREMIDVPPIPYWFAPSQKPNLIFLFLLFSQQLIIQISFCQSNDNNKSSDSNIYFFFPLLLQALLYKRRLLINFSFLFFFF